MAGSFSSVVDRDGSFRVDLIENLGDAHEALEECFDIIHNMSGGDLANVPAWRDEVPPRFKGWHAGQCEPCRGSGSIPPGSEAYNCVTCDGSGIAKESAKTAATKPKVVVEGDHPGTRRPLSEYFEKAFWVSRESMGVVGTVVSLEARALFEAMRDTLVEAERRAGR